MEGMEFNSDTLCDEFQKGCQEAGHQVRKVSLRNRKIQFCTVCYACKKTGSCIQKDDAVEILQQMTEADVIVLATPVYFYSMAGQVKTLIDRCLSCGAKLTGKEFYFIATAAAGKAEMERTIDALQGFTDCLPGAQVKGIILWSRGMAAGRDPGKSSHGGSLSDGQSCGLKK